MGVTQNRLPPQSPKQVAERLERVHFTNVKDDRPLVVRLYQREFVHRMAILENLDLNALNWDYAAVTQMVKTVFMKHGNAVPRLRRVSLSSNDITSLACPSLARGLSNCCYALDMLDLSNNPHLENVDALCPVLGSIRYVSLDHTALDTAACHTLVHGLVRLQQQKREVGNNSVILERLQVSRNEAIGNEGMARLLQLFAVVPSLRHLDLRGCGVTDDGCRSLALCMTATPRTTTSFNPPCPCSTEGDTVATVYLKGNDDISEVGRRQLMEESPTHDEGNSFGLRLVVSFGNPPDWHI